jgi:cyanophycin synthetase
MASVAAAWATGLDWDVIRAGLRTFSNDSDNAPGRFNIFNYRGATVIADYGHNPDAMLALVRAVDTLPARRRSVVISGAGDRRDDDIRQQTRILGDVFDDVLLYQDQCQRGREDGEVIALLREGLEGARRTSDIREIRGEFHAIDTAMGNLDAGDLCLILVDQIDEALAHIAGKLVGAA